MNQCHRAKEHQSLSERTSNSINSREGPLASVVKAALTFNNILLKKCSICTVYCDKQVEYEEFVQRQHDISTGAMGRLYSQLNANAGTRNEVAVSNADNTTQN